MTGLILEDFQPYAGAAFIVREDEIPPLELTLESIEPLPVHFVGVRPPFSLMFRCPDMRVLPQNIYCLEHPSMGKISLALVPVARDSGGVQYQALFN
jgi:hypothetical protein